MITEQGRELIKKADKKELLKLLSQDLGSLKLSNPEHNDIQRILGAYNQCLTEKPKKEEKK